MFDIALYIFATIIPIFFLLPWGLNMAQGMAFVFGVWTLLGVSFLSNKSRGYNNKFLGLIILLSLLNLFIHTFKFSLSHDIASNFINFCLMSEGFIYILCGCLLYWLIVNYKCKFNIVYPILIINILNLFFVITQVLHMKVIFKVIPTICGLMGTQSQLAVFSALSIPLLWNFRIKSIWTPVVLIPITILFLSKSYTGLFALYLVMIWFFTRPTQNKLRLWLWIWSGVIFTLFHIQPLIVRFSVRLETFGITLKEIFHNFFTIIFGNGFDNGFSNNMVNSIYAGGLTYRHNDLLNIASNLGLIFTGILVFVICSVIKNSKLDGKLLSILIILVSCLFQTSLYFPRIAIFLIVLLALKQAEKLDDTSR